MRISIPSIPVSAPRDRVQHTLEAGAALVADFLSAGAGKTLVMTGAGVSVDSGIAPYRGENGHYTVHTTYRPIFFHEFTDASDKGHVARQRYWSRSFLGYPPVLRAKPNVTHYSLAALQRMGHFGDFITQNVDSLHHHASPSPSLAASTILELHGTLSSVVCVSSPGARSTPIDASAHSYLTSSHMSGPRRAAPIAHNTPTGSAYPHGCGFRGSRPAYQAMLGDANPQWQRMAEDMAARRSEPKTNPDGDVELSKDTDYSSFKYAPCPSCGGILKPAVIFFGESVPDQLRDRSFELVEKASQMLVVGSSTATYSAYRLVRAMAESGRKVMVLNIGPTRADGLDIEKVELGSSETLGLAAKQLAAKGPLRDDPVLRRLLESGGVARVPNDHRVAAS
ncbi:DHS-like NAD/FAD-binding domain-containing protein [Tilletiopsis washingtonensis]|uniref:DHS-like NAD/FAD-binding domain-containing protein n=1 Tax=Tilletiopsis washingtonensis TaxID=58919 RepID=A0A316Z8C4_9BASI|nr:DHS-like NAD/FAD-binding domain-containing protein [Tilletiopsis washingtonensis]PWN97506.1 DHS-like NAD/FAD-binding domain-containing protein [Tilletiopsis washingtonensis]